MLIVNLELDMQFQAPTKLQSIFCNENRDVIEKFKKEFMDAEEIKLIYPNNIKHIKNQLVPSENHDGLFYALLEKK